MSETATPKEPVVPSAAQKSAVRLRAMIREFVMSMGEPCHTSAYAKGHALDEAFVDFLSQRWESDYGHAGFIFACFEEALK